MSIKKPDESIRLTSNSSAVSADDRIPHILEAHQILTKMGMNPHWLVDCKLGGCPGDVWNNEQNQWALGEVAEKVPLDIQKSKPEHVRKARNWRNASIDPAEDKVRELIHAGPPSASRFPL